MGNAYVCGTFDTKGDELRYVGALLRAAKIRTVLVDLGTKSTDTSVDVTASEVAGHHPRGSSAVLGLDDRGAAVAAMAEAFECFVATRNDIAGMIGLGGSGGTALIAPGMRKLPIGRPKVLVSTVASGNVAPYVGCSDICMMYSVTDVAGINRISRVVLANAAHALMGMIANAHKIEDAEVKPAIGLSMFGVTTTCVNQITAALNGKYDCLVFHATGAGGRSLEKLADSGMFVGIIDITTTEVADYLMGGILACDEDRFGSIARTRIPYVASVGALDMVNFGARESVPAHYQNRNLYVHNPQVTLMRTTADENVRIGRWIGEKMNACEGPVRFLIPEKGVSSIDAPGKPFYDPGADAALFEALEKTIRCTEKRRLMKLPYHINDPEFAAAAVTQFKDAVTSFSATTGAVPLLGVRRRN